MKRTVAKIRNRLEQLRHWEPNPVVVKELRQIVRSRVLVAALSMLLIALFGRSFIVLVGQSMISGENRQLGQGMCIDYLLVLSFASVVFVPLYVGVRLARERDECDLMFITSLSPARIVGGKMFSGAYMAAMLLSVGMPFLSFANFLRGVDLPTIFLILVCLYGLVCLAIQLAILIACLPVHKLLKGVFGIGFMFGLLAVYCGFGFFSLRLLESGVGTSIGFWAGFLILMLLLGGGILLFRVMSMSLIVSDSRPRGYFNELIQQEAQ